MNMESDDPHTCVGVIAFHYLNKTSTLFGSLAIVATL